MTMAAKSRKQEPAAAGSAKTRPVRVDLEPEVHKALRRKAADEDMSMAALARQIVASSLGFGPPRKKGGG
jgi:predicted HicB family RNase H-like nuclease